VFSSGSWQMQLLIMPIEPKWILSYSGALSFRYGRGHFAGLATVRHVSSKRAEIVASPLILGL